MSSRLNNKVTQHIQVNEEAHNVVLHFKHLILGDHSNHLRPNIYVRDQKWLDGRRYLVFNTREFNYHESKLDNSMKSCSLHEHCPINCNEDELYVGWYDRHGCSKWKRDQAVVGAAEDSKKRKKAYEEGEIWDDDDTDIEIEEDLAKSKGKWKKVKNDSIETERKDRMINRNIFDEIFHQKHDDSESELVSISSDCNLVCLDPDSINSTIYSESREPEPLQVRSFGQSIISSGSTSNDLKCNGINDCRQDPDGFVLPDHVRWYKPPYEFCRSSESQYEHLQYSHKDHYDHDYCVYNLNKSTDYIKFSDVLNIDDSSEILDENNSCRCTDHNFYLTDSDTSSTNSNISHEILVENSLCQCRDLNFGFSSEPSSSVDIYDYISIDSLLLSDLTSKVSKKQKIKHKLGRILKFLKKVITLKTTKRGKDKYRLNLQLDL